MTSSGPLERLYRVQQLDLELDRLQAEEARTPEALVEVRAESERLNNRLEDAEIELERLERQIRALEQDREHAREQVSHAKEEQQKNAYDARAQVQYQNRIQQLSDRVTETEESLAPLYERRSALQQTARSLRDEHRALRPRLAELETQDEARVQALRDEGSGTRAQRAELAGEIESRLVKEYDHLRKSKKGLGVVTFEGGRCQGCNVNLPLNIQQRAATGRLPAQKCPSCGRFLVKLSPSA